MEGGEGPGGGGGSVGGKESRLKEMWWVKELVKYLDYRGQTAKCSLCV